MAAGLYLGSGPSKSKKKTKIWPDRRVWAITETPSARKSRDRPAPRGSAPRKGAPEPGNLAIEDRREKIAEGLVDPHPPVGFIAAAGARPELGRP